jgi:hypothetical protein
MWANIITGLFTLAGLVTGVALEPVKAAFSSRARTRQIRGERCAKLIAAVTATKNGVITLNAAGRSIVAGQRRPETEQANGWIADINTARTRGRESSALLDLYGPCELGTAARNVMHAEETVYSLVNAPDDGEHDLLKMPTTLVKATEELDLATQQFAQLAHKFVR